MVIKLPSHPMKLPPCACAVARPTAPGCATHYYKNDSQERLHFFQKRTKISLIPTNGARLLQQLTCLKNDICRSGSPPLSPLKIVRTLKSFLTHMHFKFAIDLLLPSYQLFWIYIDNCLAKKLFFSNYKIRYHCEVT